MACLLSPCRSGDKDGPVIKSTNGRAKCSKIIFSPNNSHMFFNLRDLNTC
ncbi:unnamed protein product [Hymenolepis diminuta]|uniref:Uncharacterized protein n=1 Tax=Hymenolepis diminuta TaxID=6216 RepID=A0A564YWV0_HYMDI|nr:unnamed protein product [Hymenolepis diminuta]